MIYWLETGNSALKQNMECPHSLPKKLFKKKIKFIEPCFFTGGLKY